MWRIAHFQLAMLLSALTAGASLEAPRSAPLRLLRTIPMPGVEGRIDHLALDSDGERLFVAALGNNTVEVLDLRAGRRVHEISGLHEPQGLCFVPGLDRLVIANGDGGAVELRDGGDFHLLQRVSFDEDADNLRLDREAGFVCVGYGNGALAVLDPANGKRIGDVSLDGHPESFQLESAGPRSFVNVPTAKEVAVVDRVKRSVVAKWPVSGAESNFPMALDEESHRLFIGCRRPARLLAYDTESGTVVGSVDIAGDTDDLFYDAARRRIYASCGAGFISVIEQRDADHYTLATNVPTALGARTALFVPQSSELFLAVPHRGRQGAEIRVYQVLP